MAEQNNSEFAGRHPVVIMLYVLACVIWTMITRHPVALLVSFLISAAYCVILHGMKRWVGLLAAGGVMLFFAVIILPFFSHRGVTPLFYVNGLAVTWETVFYGMIMTMMLLAVLQWCMVAGCLMDSEKLLYLTGKTIPTIGLMLMMIFRTLPDMRDRYRQIHEAQIGLGKAGKAASRPGRVQSFLRELSILISWSLEDSIEVSVSMESRGYRTGKRTWFHLFHIRKEDIVWCIFMLLTFTGMYVSQGRGGLQAFYFPELVFRPVTGWNSTALAAGALGMAAPAVYDLYGRRNRKGVCTQNGTDTGLIM